MNTFPIYAGGNFITTPTDLPVRNPFTGEIFATTFLADALVLENSIFVAQRARKIMRDLPVWKKAESLNNIAVALKSDREYHAKVLSAESAKPLCYALSEVDRAVQTFLIAAEECKRLPKEYMSMDWTPSGERREGLVGYFPSGLVAGISPFNFPLNLAVHKIAPAIAAGCPIILKPASSTPLSTLLLAKIIDKTDLPKGSVAILPMNRTTGNLLVTDERFSLLSFTGSPEVGWEMKKNAGKKKVVLELGGNAGVIVSENVNSWSDTKKRDMVRKCVAGGFAYSGQICIHAQRFFVHESCYDEFVNAFISEIKNLKQGDPLEETVNFSSMIDEANARRVESWITEAKQAGARVLCGGARDGSLVVPTVLTATNPKMKVNSEEIFGPVVIVEKFQTLKQAVDMVNDSRFGLQCGVFTDSIEEMNYCFREIEAGGIILNEAPTLRFDHMPYGGVKDSGLGREGIRYAIMDMMETKVLIK